MTERPQVGVYLTGQSAWRICRPGAAKPEPYSYATFTKGCFALYICEAGIHRCIRDNIR